MIDTYVSQNRLPLTVKNFAYRDEFIVQGSVGELQAEYGVDTNAIAEYIQNSLKQA